jgi:hypothetical protein
MPQKPYIGVTGFTNGDEVRSLLDTIPQNTNRLIMVGVLASSKTLRGIPNKWPARYPRPVKLRNIFKNHPLALNLIHYNTKEPGTLLEQIKQARELAGPNLHGFQLNMAWPNPRVLAKIAMQSQRTIIVLQVGRHAFQMIGHSPKLLADKIKEYEGCIDYVLLDPSGGYGKPLDSKTAQLYLEALTIKDLPLGLGVAGGLSATTLNLLEPLVSQFPNLSIDAEGKLRNKKDRLDLQLTQKYVQSALTLFG